MTLLLHPAYRAYRIVSGARHWCQRRLTPAGLGLLCALMVALIMGPDTENNVAYQALTLLVCLLAVAAAFSWWFRVAISARRLLPRFGTAGCPIAYVVKVTNLTSKKQAGLMLMEELEDPRPKFGEWRAGAVGGRREI